MSTRSTNCCSLASYPKNLAAANILSIYSRSGCPSSWKLKTIWSRIILSRTKWGKNSLKSSILHCSQFLPFLKQSPKNLRTAKKTKGKIQITNILSSVSPKACISSNLLTSRKMASGSSEDKDGTCRNNSTKNRNWVITAAHMISVNKILGSAINRICWQISLDTCCSELTSCLLVIALAFKWPTSLWHSNRTDPSLSNPFSGQSRRNLSEENLYIPEAVKAMQYNQQATRPSNRNSTAQLACDRKWDYLRKTTLCYQLMNPHVASHKGSVTRCRSEGPHNSALSPLSRRISNNRVLWGMISSTRTQYNITQ